MDWAKAEMLAEIMYQEDEYNYAHGKPLVYFAEDDFIAEREEKIKIFKKVLTRRPKCDTITVSRGEGKPHKPERQEQ